MTFQAFNRSPDALPEPSPSTAPTASPLDGDKDSITDLMAGWEEVSERVVPPAVVVHSHPWLCAGGGPGSVSDPSLRRIPSYVSYVFGFIHTQCEECEESKVFAAQGVLCSCAAGDASLPPPSPSSQRSPFSSHTLPGGDTGRALLLLQAAVD